MYLSPVETSSSFLLYVEGREMVFWNNY